MRPSRLVLAFGWLALSAPALADDAFRTTALEDGAAFSVEALLPQHVLLVDDSVKARLLFSAVRHQPFSYGTIGQAFSEYRVARNAEERQIFLAGIQPAVDALVRRLEDMPRVALVLRARLGSYNFVKRGFLVELRDRVFPVADIGFVRLVPRAGSWVQPRPVVLSMGEEQAKAVVRAFEARGNPQLEVTAWVVGTVLRANPLASRVIPIKVRELQLFTDPRLAVTWEKRTPRLEEYWTPKP